MVECSSNLLASNPPASERGHTLLILWCIALFQQPCNIVPSADRHRYYLLFAAVVIFLILPLWPPAILPWTDLGDHMARVYILHRYDDVPIFRQYYEIERLPLPNLAM